MGPVMRPTDSIAMVDGVTVDSAVTIDNVTFSAGTVTFRAAGGAPGVAYPVRIEITTAGSPEQTLVAFVALRILVAPVASAPLSPWPDDPEPLASATERLATAIGTDPAASQDERQHNATARRLGALAAALAERYAAAAPQAVKDEAVIRAAGYLAQSDFGGIVSESIGPREVSYTVNHSALFRNSGAAALLSPWKRRQAGIIG